MDYAKEAYSLATELERKLSGTQSSFSASGTTFTGQCPAGTATEVARYTGGAALLVLTVTSEGEGGCDVLCGGVKTGRVQSGGSFPFVFAVSEAASISLLPAGGVTVTGVTVSAVGTNSAFADGGGKFAADARGIEVYAAENKDGLRLKRFMNRGKFEDAAVFAAASDFDVAASPTGALVAACDGKGNCSLFHVSRSGEVITAATDNCLRVAVAYTGYGYAVAAFDGRKVKFTVYGEDLSPRESSRAHGSPSVDKLALVKGKAFPSLVIEDGGKVLVRPPAPESRAAVRIAVTAALTER